MVAILNDLAINIGAVWAAVAFEIVAQFLRDINIQTVPRKSHMLLRWESTSLLSTNLGSEI